MTCYIRADDVRSTDADDYVLVATLVQDTRGAEAAEHRLWGSFAAHDRAMTGNDTPRFVVAGVIRFSDAGGNDTQRSHRQSLPQPDQERKNRSADNA
jgi:hypothetical protein